MSKKLNVALIFGGKSVEHDISLKSAQNVNEYIDHEKYQVLLIGIDKKGGWHLTKSAHHVISADPKVVLTNEQELFEIETGKVHPIDVVFPVLHGTDGEDGSIQGLIKSCNLPCVGSSVLGSAVAMNKLLSKKLLQASDIPTSKFLGFRYDQRNHIDFSKVTKVLGLPLMAKPSNLGSSVGVSKVIDKESFENAIKECFRYDNELLFEQFINGRELECAILGNENAEATVPGEIIIKGDYDFYSFEAKYVDSNAVDLQIPANVSEETITLIKDLSIKAYRALNCEDFARVDLFLTDEGHVFINEINTIPGFTANSSMFPKLWEHAGISYVELINTLITLAIERFKTAQRIQTDFDSNLTER